MTEWCKKEDCWCHLQTLGLVVSEELEDELAEGQPLPTVGSSSKQGYTLTPVDRENIARVMQVPAETWIHISGWGAKTRNLEGWLVSIATTLASYAAGDWQRVPSVKQAKHGVGILQIAAELDGMPRVED